MVEDRREEEGIPGEAADGAGVARLVELPRPGGDREARWLRKVGRLHFGYKCHTVTNQEGLVLAEVTTPANESDTRHLAGPVARARLPKGTPVMADKGYDSAENRGELRGRQLKVRIMRKAVKGRGLTARERAVNRAISRVRYRVERTFGSMRRWFGAGIARYVGLQKTHAQHIMESIAYKLYRAPGIIVSNGIE